ncbi:hypothetical protein ASD03_26810 [Ensifer sp. Root127]|nr:hypothetical protein ASD03_26810 [Ensifer sp. Root127]
MITNCSRYAGDRSIDYREIWILKIGTIENLFSKIYGYVAMVLDETMTRSAKSLSIALTGIVLSGAISLSPMAARIADATWVNKATEIIAKQIEKLSD